MKENKTLIFVYGTLMFGHGNSRLLVGSEFVRNDKIIGYKLVTDQIIPFAIKDKDSEICGEVYEVDDTTLKAIDELEGHPTCYKRVMEKTQGALIVFVYTIEEFLGECNIEIEDGDYKKYIINVINKKHYDYYVKPSRHKEKLK